MWRSTADDLYLSIERRKHCILSVECRKHCILSVECRKHRTLGITCCNGGQPALYVVWLGR
jgi:hypothetical protein